ncbi:hypothetical protein ACJ72_07319 [Emergomyces africanus]|uniref:Uncharacterized protein n=1 Tax=Emergomyces africanus TaxID=1955775 RepID=A0A1B7NNK2_9EURO|nr:hypothetical protein ACJ72_07319 [Emergomyces africanus]
MGHHARRRWLHNGAHLKVRSALGAGNALVGVAIGHKDERRSGKKPRLEKYEKIGNIAAVVKVDRRGRLLDRSKLNDLQARQAQAGSGDPNVVVSTVIHVMLENGSTVGTFTVSTLPATVSNSDLGRVTIPAENDSPVTISTTSPKNPPLPAPTPKPAPSGPNTSVPTTDASTKSTPDDPTISPTANPTPSIPITSTTSSKLTQSTTNTPSSSSTSTSDPNQAPPAVSSPTASASSSRPTSTSAAKDVPLPTFIALPIPANSTSAAPIPPAARIGILPSSEPVSQGLLPSTDSSTATSTFSSYLPSASASFTPASSTSLSSPSSLSISRSTASASSSTTTIVSPTYAGGFGGGGGGGGGGYGDATATLPGDIPTLAGGDSADVSNSSVVPASKVVGGVVGGVAGVVLLVVVALLLLRTRKRKGSHSRELTAEDHGTAAMLHTGVAGAMTERSVSTTAGGSALGAAALFSKWRNSQQSTRTLEPPQPSSERGFQKVSGRKITSVLESGGDGYDDPFGAAGENLYYETATTTPVFREAGSPTTITPIVSPFSSGFQPRPSSSRNGTSRSAGLIGQPLHAPPLCRPTSQESDSSAHVVLRPSPARTPLTSSADVTTTTTLATSGSIALHPPPHESLPRLPIHRRVSGQDAIGRSMASSDGSRASRFTEGI